jgi:hypothetical protein
MREFTEEFDRPVLNPSGGEIRVPFWVFKRLKKFHLIERDRATGKQKIRAIAIGLMEIWEGPEFNPDRRFRTTGHSYPPTRPKDSGYSNAFLKALGRDCSGLA